MKQRTGRQIYSISDWSGGLITPTAAIQNQSNGFPFTRNVESRFPGELRTDRGFNTFSGPDVSNAPWGVWEYKKGDGYIEIIVGAGSKIYRLNNPYDLLSSAFESIDNVARPWFFEAINGYINSEHRLYFPAGVGEDIGYYNGTTVAQVTDVKAVYMAFFQNSIYIANCKFGSTAYPERVAWSQPGTDTFDTAVDFFDDMGATVTGMKVFGNKLCIFTESSVATWDGLSLTFLEGIRGTRNGCSAQIADGQLIWWAGTKIYAYDGINRPRSISDKIQNVFEYNQFLEGWGPGSVTWEDHNAVVDKYGRYYLYVDGLNMDSINTGLYEYVTLRYTPQTDSWDILDGIGVGQGVSIAGDSISSHPWPTTFFCDINSSDIGEFDGAENIIPSNGDPWVETFRLDFDRPYDTKHFYKSHVTHKPDGNDGKYLTIKYRLDSEISWHQIGGTNNNVLLEGTDPIKTVTLDLPADCQGKLIQFQLTTDDWFILYKLDIEYDVIATV